MTSDTGSVWDRDRGDEGPEVGDGGPAVAEHGEALDGSEDGVLDAGAGSVWSRGPSVDEALQAVQQWQRAPVRQPVLPPPDPVIVSRRTAARARRPVGGIALVAVAAAAVAWTLGFVGDDDAGPAVAGTSTQPVVPIATAPSTSGPLPGAATTTSTSAPSATTTSTSTPPTTTTSTSTPSATTTSTTTSTTTGATVGPVPVVAIVGRIGPCAFGSDCLIADFSIANFPEPQREFVCEFGGGDRYTFRFDGESAASACATSAVDGSITIEVGGVRSETITR